VDDLGYLLAGAFCLGVAFLIVLVAFIGWLQDNDRSKS
jgi:hypothetical protein